MRKFIPIKSLKEVKSGFNFKKLLEKFQKKQSTNKPVSSLILGKTAGFADFLPNNTWEWFVSL